jgi:hypothetical protein
MLYACNGDLSISEEIYCNHNWVDVLKAIRFNLRKELISIYAPSMPYMDDKARRKVFEQIEGLTLSAKPKTSNIAKIESKRAKRLRKAGLLHG